MKLAIVYLSLALAAASVTASANDIVIYKSSSTRPWSQYACTRPGGAAPIPKTALAGSYIATEYMVFDQTTHKLQTVYYWSYVDRGATFKQYETGDPIDLTEGAIGARAQRVIKSNLANTYFVCLSGGDYFEDTDSDQNGDTISDYYYATDGLNLVGTGKPHVVVAGVGGLTLQKVAPSLTGQYIYSNRLEYRQESGPLHYVSVYFESGPQTLTLDVLSTKAANTGANLLSLDGGTSLTKQTLAYGVRVAQLALEKLGYDSTDDIPIAP